MGCNKSTTWNIQRNNQKAERIMYPFLSLSLFSLFVASCQSFSSPLLYHRQQLVFLSTRRQHEAPLTRLQLSDFDFPSAMPAKPQLTLEQKMEQSADDFIESMTNALGEGVQAPPELEELRNLRKKPTDSSTLTLKIYELMIERGLRYDQAPETGILTDTEFNIPENLEVKEVQDEFGHLYRYGMMLMDRGLLTVDQLKETVLERLIKRTGLTPEEFDAWLGY